MFDLVSDGKIKECWAECKNATFVYEEKCVCVCIYIYIYIIYIYIYIYILGVGID